MNVNAYFEGIDRTLKRIADEKPDTADGVIAILNTFEPKSSGDAFIDGTGSDLTLEEVLMKAGWRTVWAEADYYYVSRSKTGEMLTYVEGDVYRGDVALKGEDE